MRLHLLNPNTNAEMTQQMAVTAQQAALADTRIVASCPENGPVSIESAVDEAIAGAALLDEIQKYEGEGVDGHIIACFGDPSLEAARELCTSPVIGIAEAAFHFASMLGFRFAVVTTLSRTVPTAWHLLHKYGFERQCTHVYASELPVLSLEHISDEAYAHLLAQCQQALEGGAEVIVLGCAGMAGFADQLQQSLQVPVIDGVRAAVKLLESLSQLGLKTAKCGQYGTPFPKTYLGRYQHWSR